MVSHRNVFLFYYYFFRWRLLFVIKTFHCVYSYNNCANLPTRTRTHIHKIQSRPMCSEWTFSLVYCIAWEETRMIPTAQTTLNYRNKFPHHSYYYHYQKQNFDGAMSLVREDFPLLFFRVFVSSCQHGVFVFRLGGLHF